MDKLLGGTRTAGDPAKRQQLFNDIQKRIVEQAYIIHIAAPKIATATSNRVKNAVVGVNGFIFLNDAYIEAK